MPIWVKCDDCEDYWCTHHNAHAFDCSCCGTPYDLVNVVTTIKGGEVVFRK